MMFGSVSGMVSSAPPVRPVDRDVDAPAVLGRDQLVDRRVDRRVLPADTGSGDESAHEVPHGVHRERRQDGADQVDEQRENEQLLAAEAVGELTEEQRPDA
jgi:hypothetical protein